MGSRTGTLIFTLLGTSERNDSRLTSRRTGDLTADQRLAIAARLAAVTVFCNKFAVWNGVLTAAPEREDVLVRTLAGGTEFVGEDEFPVGEEAINETLGTGLFSARGSEKLGWAHQTYAEFLAARYLLQRNVSTDKAVSLITHPDDKQGKLVPQLHETSAWLASMSPEIFRTIVDIDPEVLLRSDVASTDEEDKVALVATLLRLYDDEKLFDTNLVPRSQYRKLNYPGLAEQLRPYIVDANKNFVVRRVALDIAETCELRALQYDTAAVALDATQPRTVRPALVGLRTATIGLDVHFLGAVREGRITCSAEVVHRTRRIATVEAKVRDTDDNLVAMGTGTFRIFEKQGNPIV